MTEEHKLKIFWGAVYSDDNGLACIAETEAEARSYFDPWSDRKLFEVKEKMTKYDICRFDKGILSREDWTRIVGYSPFEDPLEIPCEICGDESEEMEDMVREGFIVCNHCAKSYDQEKNFKQRLKHDFEIEMDPAGPAFIDEHHIRDIFKYCTNCSKPTVHGTKTFISTLEIRDDKDVLIKEIPIAQLCCPKCYDEYLTHMEELSKKMKKIKNQSNFSKSEKQ